MSIVRALIKFKGDVRAAADYILAGAPLERPKWVLRDDELFYPLIDGELEFEAGGNGSTFIQDGETFILEKDLGNFDLFYLSHVHFEEDFKSELEKLIHTFQKEVTPAEASVIVPPLPEVRDNNSDVVNFKEFEPKGIKPGVVGDGRFVFLFDVVREDKRKQTNKSVYMTLNTAQLYLERRANFKNDWLLPGLLARLIGELGEGDFKPDERAELQNFSQRNYVTFGRVPQLWSGRYFVDDKQFEFFDQDLYAVYESLRDLATIDNQSPKYLLFQMVENSVNNLFKDIDTDGQQQEWRDELNSILQRIIKEEGSAFSLKSFIGPKAYKVLNQEEDDFHSYLTFGSFPKLWSGEYFVDGKKFTFTNEMLYSPVKKSESVYKSLKALTDTPARLLFQMVENSVDDLFKDIDTDDTDGQQQARLSELNIILYLMIKEEGKLLEHYIDKNTYAVLDKWRRIKKRDLR